MPELPSVLSLSFAEGKVPELRIESRSNSARTVQVRGFTKHGIVQIDHTTAADRSLTATNTRLDELPIAFAVGLSAAGVRRGECYVRVALRMGGVLVDILTSGYVSDERGLWWPGGPLEHSLEGPGFLRSVLGTDPAAGAEISETVPTNTRWRLLAAIVTLVTDATVANRRTIWLIDDGATVLWFGDDNVNHAPSTTIPHLLSPSPIRGTLNYGYNTSLGTADTMLLQGWRLRTTTQAMVAGDNYGAPQLWVEEWIEE